MQLLKILKVELNTSKGKNKTTEFISFTYGGGGGREALGRKDYLQEAIFSFSDLPWTFF